jgi:hypothetical protein
MLPLLRLAKEKVENFAPRFILADKAYHGYENHKGIVEELNAIPIIDLPKGGKRFEDLCDEKGTPYCAADIPYIFWGYDKKQKVLKYRCPLACGKQGCLWIEKCSNSPYGQVVKLRLSDDYRRFIQVPRHTKRWKELYNKRVNVEHTFAMSKGFRALERPRVRGIDNVRLHCLLSIIAMQAWALGMIRLGQPERIRSCVHGISQKEVVE